MISLPRVKTRLGISLSDLSQDVLLQELVDNAVALIGTITNRYWGLPREKIEYLIGQGIPDLALNSLPYVTGSAEVVDVTEQKAPGLLVTVLDDTAADGYELRRSARNAWLKRFGGYVWRNGFEYVTEYMEGWDVDGLPGDIEGHVFNLIGRRFESIESGEFKSETLGQYDYTRFTEADLSESELAWLLGWRDPVFA